VASRFELYEAVNVLPFFDLHYVHNTGAAFSFLDSAGGWQRWLFTGIAVVISGLIVYWLRRTPKSERWMSVALALVLGGAVGNLIDRAWLGYVIDFIDIYFDVFRFVLGSNHFPAFNIADSAICVGAGMLIVDAFRGKHESLSHPSAN